MSINIWAVVVSALASMVIGSVWYGPLFGKKFRVAMGMDKWSPEKQAAMKKSMGASFFLQFVASLVMFYVLAKLINGAAPMTMHTALMTAFWVWLGFVVPVKLGDAIWGGSKTLFWIGISNMFVTLLVTAAIISAWR
jgi:hypothetical protein